MSAVAVVTGVVGWLVYDAMVAPAWLRDFGLEIAARAKIVAVSKDQTAFSTMEGRAEPDSPYICFSQVAEFDWDRVYVVPSGGAFSETLAALDWANVSISEIKSRMVDDPRYQVIAFEHGGVVVEHDYYFTLWGDLSALAQPTGFNRAEAIFVAESDGETYTVKPAQPVTDAPCL